MLDIGNLEERWARSGTTVHGAFAAWRLLDQPPHRGTIAKGWFADGPLLGMLPKKLTHNCAEGG